MLNTTKSSPCLNTETADSLEWYRQGDKCPVKMPIVVMTSLHAASKQRVTSFVPYMELSKTAYPLLQSSCWHSTLTTMLSFALLWTCVHLMWQNPKIFTLADDPRFPVMRRPSMNLRLSSGRVAANKLLASSNVNSLTRVGSWTTNLTRTNRRAASSFFVCMHLVPKGFSPDSFG